MAENVTVAGLQFLSLKSNSPSLAWSQVVERAGLSERETEGLLDYLFLGDRRIHPFGPSLVFQLKYMKE